MIPDPKIAIPSIAHACDLWKRGNMGDAAALDVIEHIVMGYEEEPGDPAGSY